MSHAEDERAGVIVVRAWVDTGASSGLRARVTASRDLSCDEQTIAVAASVADVVAAVRDWLEAFVAS